MMRIHPASAGRGRLPASLPWPRSLMPTSKTHGSCGSTA